MAASFHVILDQVDGVKDTFTLPESFIIGSVAVAYNGQLYNVGQNITSEDPNATPLPTVTLSFVPASDSHTLMLVYTSTASLEGSAGIRAFTYPPGGLLNDF